MSLKSDIIFKQTNESLHRVRKLFISENTFRSQRKAKNGMEKLTEASKQINASSLFRFISHYQYLNSAHFLMKLKIVLS